ncbi:hypothetical protein STA3757_12840 [Stanieria sp. NIES-3757]|nr:hypothetical protein STA3757_12840 [Stanieria sp. NIES-3757]
MQSLNQDVFTLSLIRLVGYGLLGMTLIDFISLILPLQLMNSAWELQTMGAFIERIPVPLLGIAFIYYGKRSYRAPIENLLLKWLSYFSLILAILFLLMIPLAISNTIRINLGNNAVINQEIFVKVQQIDKFKDKITAAKSSTEIQAILQQQSYQGTIPDTFNVQEIQEPIIKELNNTEKKLRNEIESVRATKRWDLLKKSIKWNLGALITSCLFFVIWKDTFWARLEQLEDDYS